MCGFQSFEAGKHYLSIAGKADNHWFSVLSYFIDSEGSVQYKPIKVIFPSSHAHPQEGQAWLPVVVWPHSIQTGSQHPGVSGTSSHAFSFSTPLPRVVRVCVHV